jgi:hypothetical protein
MTQALYAHMNNKTILKKRKEGREQRWEERKEGKIPVYLLQK